MDHLLNSVLRESDQLLEDQNGTDFEELSMLLEQAQTYILDLQSQVKGLHQRNSMLQTEINSLRQTSQDHSKLLNESMIFLKKNEEAIIIQQKDQYEETIKRQLKVIEGLVDDKRVLQEEVESLRDEIKRQASRIDAIQRGQDEKLKVVRDQVLALEAAKREKWEKRRAAELKEMTIRSLEPELQKLIHKHELELRTVKAFYEQKIAEMANN